MSPPIPNTPGQIPHTPIPGGQHNQYDKFETSLSDDEAIIALAQSTKNGNSEAIANGISSSLDAFVEKAIGRPIIDLTSETPRNEISEVDASDSDSDSNIAITRGAPLSKG